MERVERDPRLLDRARARVSDWRAAWNEILQLPLPELTRRVLDTSQAGIDRRQVSPFAGVLAPRERWKILRQVGRPDPSASC